MASVGMNQQTPYGEYLRSHGNRGFDWRMAAPVVGMAALPALGVFGAAAGGGSAAGGAATAAGAGGGMTAATGLGIGQILSSTFGNLWGAQQTSGAAREAAEIQAKTARELAQMEMAAQDKKLQYLQGIEARDYNDWLTREARDRRDWEASEQRKAPFRALADASIRTLADYIRVPGMRPAQEVPVQVWTHQPQSPVSTPMPVDPGTGFVSPQRRTLADYAW